MMSTRALSSGREIHIAEIALLEDYVVKRGIREGTGAQVGVKNGTGRQAGVGEVHFEGRAAVNDQVRAACTAKRSGVDRASY
jgi:hypothetical protein